MFADPQAGAPGLRADRAGLEQIAADLAVTAGEEAAAAFRRQAGLAGAPLSARPPEPTFVVIPQNGPAARAYMLAQTQWRRAHVAGLGGGATWREGLDYQGVEAACRLAGLDLSPDDFAGLQVIEAEAIALDINRASRPRTAKGG